MLAAALLLLAAAAPAAHAAEGLALETCENLGYHSTLIEPTAQALIATIFPVRGRGSLAYGCGSVELDQQPVEAIRWALERINQDSGTVNGEVITDSYIPGIKIGTTIMDSCGQPELAYSNALDFMPSLHSAQGWCNASTTNILLGYIELIQEGQKWSSLAEFLESYGVAWINFSDSIASMEFFHHAQVLTSTAAALDWTSFSVIYPNDDYGSNFLKVLSTDAKARGLCVSDAVSVQPETEDEDVLRRAIARAVDSGVTGVVLETDHSLTLRLLKAAETVPGAGDLQFMLSAGFKRFSQAELMDVPMLKGAIKIDPTVRNIPEFEDHWVRLDENNPPADNPWYQEWYMTTNECRLSGVTADPFVSYPLCVPKSEANRRNEFQMTHLAENAIVAIYSFAKALKTAHAALCGSQRGLCTGLRSLAPETFYKDYLLQLDFTFSGDERVATLASSQIPPFNSPKRVSATTSLDSYYDIHNYQLLNTKWQFVKVGSFIKDSLTLDKSMIKMYDKTRTTPLTSLPASTCPAGGCRRCYSGLVQNEDEFAYTEGHLLIGATFPVHTKGDSSYSCGPIDPSQIQLLEAFLFGISMANSQAPNQAIKFGGLAFDNCGSPELAKNKLANFNTGSYKLMRNGESISPVQIQLYIGGENNHIAVAEAGVLTPHNLPLLAYGAHDSKLAHPLFASTRMSQMEEFKLAVLILKKLGINYVQQVYDNLNEDVAMMFVEMAAKEGICVAASSVIDKDVAGALMNNKNAQVVLVWAAGMERTKFVGMLADASSDVRKHFTLVHSAGVDDLATKPSDAIKEVIDGSIYWAIRKNTELLDITEFLKGHKAGEYMDNPWFNEWYEMAYNCYMSADETRGYPKLCDNLPITDSAGFVLNHEVVFVIPAITIATKGLQVTLEQFCGVGYDHVCKEFSSAANKSEVILKNIRELKFAEKGFTFHFDKDGFGVRAVDIYSVKDGQATMVGTSAEGTFELSASMVYMRPGTTSACPGSCPQCNYVAQHSDYMKVPGGDFFIGGLFDVHGSGPTPYSCGALRAEYSFQYTEAFRFALHMVNTGQSTVKLNNVSLGGLGFDVCTSGLKAASIVDAVHSESKQIEGVDPKRIVSWISQSSEESLEVADVTRGVGVPQVGLTATFPLLQDAARAPTFFYTQTTEDVQARGIARLVQHMGWRYVQLVFEASSWGRVGAEALRASVRDVGVCVLAEHELSLDGEYSTVLTDMLSVPTDVVLVYAEMPLVRKLLEAKMSAGTAARHFTLVAADMSGNLDEFGAGLGETAHGLITFKTNSPHVPGFDQYMAGLVPGSSMGNPWFTEYYMWLYQCNLPGHFLYPTDCLQVGTPGSLGNATNYRQDSQLVNTVNAVFMIANGLDASLRSVCGDQYDSVCQQMKDMDTMDLNKMIMEKMESASFTSITGQTFFLQDRQFDQGYTIYSYNTDGSHAEIGKYARAGLVMTGSSPASLQPDVGCGAQCAQCQQAEQRQEQFTYIPGGDVILAGIFDVHESGSSPFTCGELHPNQGIQLLEAFQFAIHQVNSGRGLFQGKLRGLRLGGLGLDACMSATRAGNLVANIHSNFLPLSSGGESINPAKIDAYVGAFTSAASMQVADVLTVLGIPQISYGATSVALQDGERYPWFLRTVPADDRQARALVALLTKYSVQYVQVVHSPGIYGEGLATEFTRQAAAADICVAQTVSIMDATTNSAATATVRKLLEKPSAKVVMVFLDTGFIRPFLMGVQGNDQARALFKFVASETWADNTEVVRGLEDVAQGAITLGVETSDLPAFDQYLEPKNPNNYFSNPWFNEYYEYIFNCSLSGTTPKYSQRCANSVQSIVRAQGRYRQDAYVLYTVNAVYAIAEGLHLALNKSCGTNYNGMCEQFKSNMRQNLLEGIRSVRFDDEAQQVFTFNSRGESNRGYHIYTLRATGGGGVYYQHEGSYNDSHLLKMDSSFSVSWDSTCQASGACGECPQVSETQTRHLERASPAGLNLVSFFNLHQAEPSDPFRCGPMHMDNFVGLLAYLFAMDQVNSKENPLQLPADIKLGSLALDACDNTMSAVKDLYSIMSGQGLCYDKTEVVSANTVVYTADMGNDVSLDFQAVLSPLSITSLSASSTAPTLSARPFFLRTVPSASQAAKALVETARAMGWAYVGLVVSAGEDGHAGRDQFLQHARGDNSTGRRAVCVGPEVSLDPAAAAGEEATEAAKAALETVYAAGARVVVLFTSPQHTRLVLRAAEETRLAGKLTLMGAAESWADIDPVREYGAATDGALTVQLASPVSSKFASYLESLTVAHHPGIPDDWFEEFWQRSIQCQLTNATSRVLTEFPRPCTAGDRLSGSRLARGTHILPTIIQVQVIATALSKVTCDDSSIPLSTCLQTPSGRQQLYQHIKEASWQSQTDDLSEVVSFRFTEEGDGDLDYELLNYQHSQGYVKVGTFGSSLSMNTSVYRGPGGAAAVSQCPRGVTCTCVGGTGLNGGNTGGRFVTDGGNTGESKDPTSGGFRDPSENFNEVWKIVVAVLAGIGILVTLFLLLFLLIYYPVRGGTSAVGYLLLLTVLLLYVLTFAFIVIPSAEVCAVRRFCLGVVYALAFACLLVKVLNTWRIGPGFDEFSLPEYRRLSHPVSLFFITLGITAVQVIIGVEWLVLKPPNSVMHTFEDEDSDYTLEVCEDSWGSVSFHYEELVLSCVYVMLLILLSLIFSLVTWDSEENHRESRWISITSIFSICIWLVWTIVSTISAYRFRDPAIAIGLVANATVILLCVFVRKLWLLSRYEKEIEEEKRSHLSSSTTQLDDTNGVYANPMYLYVDSGSVAGSSQIMYQAPRTPQSQGADLAY